MSAPPEKHSRPTTPSPQGWTPKSFSDHQVLPKFGVKLCGAQNDLTGGEPSFGLHFTPWHKHLYVLLEKKIWISLMIRNAQTPWGGCIAYKIEMLDFRITKSLKPSSFTGFK